MSKQTFQHDVTIIGAGWSGLVACKYMLCEGLSVVALEKREDLGGVWLYSDDPSTFTVMRSTRCTSSSTVTEMSDFPMTEEMGLFPHHSSILAYLRRYVEEFRLGPHIRTDVEVRSAYREDGLWRVECANGDAYASTYLVVATGLVQKPNLELLDTTLKGFSGKVYHAGEIKAPLEEHRDQRLLVVGGGETGSDLCMEWYNHVRCIYWSIPRGQHFFRKYGKASPWTKPQALDKASSRAMKTITPFHKGKPGLAWICKWTTSGSLLAYQGHGIPEWKNDAEFFRFVINKHGQVLDLVDRKKLVPKGAIARCLGKEVTFADGSKQEFDLAIMSTGYKTHYPFLPQRYCADLQQRYKYVFDVEDPSIAFIGLARPVVGSIVGISELQARWISRVWSGKVDLKPTQERRCETEADAAHWNRYFKDSSRRLQGLVEGYTYVDDIAKKAGVYPDYWSLFKSNPYHWFVAVFSPYNAAIYWLNDPSRREQAIHTMERHRRGTLTPLHLLLLLFLRATMFDWWINKISNVKYRVQTSRWWPHVAAFRVVRAVNYVWCLPKRVLFDNKSLAP